MIKPDWLIYIAPRVQMLCPHHSSQIFKSDLLPFAACDMPPLSLFLVISPRKETFLFVCFFKKACSSFHIDLYFKLKNTFTQRLQFSHYLLTPLLMESQFKLGLFKFSFLG